MDGSIITITPEIARAAVYGGAFLGGGGGGSVETGLITALEALKLGDIKIVPLDCIADDASVITASAVGAPAAQEGYVTAEHCKRAMELFQDFFHQEIKGVITNENGGHSTTNGWVLSAITGIPVIDAPCNGRAHPTGQMGSMGLSMDPSYVSCQVAVGGKEETGKYLEMAVRGRLDAASRLVRRAAVEAGGLVTVLRNCVKAGYLRKNAAPGALKQAIKVGEIFLNNEGDYIKILQGLSRLMPLEVISEGTVRDFKLETRDGFDVGKMMINEIEVTFWNEYMTVEKEGERLATFPDLIVTLDLETGKVKTSAQVAKGDKLALIKVPKHALILGKGMYDQQLFVEVERIINKQMVDYHFSQGD
ncbi:DUF917 family protein [Thermanaerosceptrum fracticalcis]|uniref:DUF917 family protein n=1 Tax=Thermanaerosceptrum fracticalcis TaxID=1712410 RepID=A0A7G6DYY1_THEFR|nr:DUF917 family protein [Thermanaerosceptrum fracticalcis]QNB45035.1 DUF917 family protein [Thermanaerosceptrum fracticalcis]